MKRILTTIFLMFFLSMHLLWAQEIPKEVLRAFEKGTPEMLTPYLGEEVECNLPAFSNKSLNPEKVKEVLNDFFKKYKPNSFTLLHQGKRTESSFFVATMKSDQESYRINILFRKKDNKFLINQIRIVTLNG